jgi:hypothetical protein
MNAIMAESKETCWNWCELACPGTVSLPNSGRSSMTEEGRIFRNGSAVCVVARGPQFDLLR